MASEKRYSFSTAATFDQAHKVIERRISMHVKYSSLTGNMQAIKFQINQYPVVISINNLKAMHILVFTQSHFLFLIIILILFPKGKG